MSTTQICESCPLRAVRTGVVVHNRQVHWNGTCLGLTLAEERIVLLLAAVPGRWRTGRELYDQVRPDRPGFQAGGRGGISQNVRSIMKRIRNKFRAIDPDFRMIQTLTGVGYRWEPVPVVEEEELVSQPVLELTANIGE